MSFCVLVVISLSLQFYGAPRRGVNYFREYVGLDFERKMRA